MQSRLYHCPRLRRSGTWRFGASWPLRACALVVTHRESKMTVMFSLMTGFTEQLPVLRGVIGPVMISMVYNPLIPGRVYQVLPAPLTKSTSFFQNSSLLHEPTYAMYKLAIFGSLLIRSTFTNTDFSTGLLAILLRVNPRDFPFSVSLARFAIGSSRTCNEDFLIAGFTLSCCHRRLQMGVTCLLRFGVALN